MEKIQKFSFIEFDYVNWKGVESHREASVIDFYFGSTEFQKEEQWIMKARDVEKQDERDFAMKDMRNVKRIR